MTQETQGKATSPEDVRRQTAGQPTTTQQGTTGAPAPSLAADAVREAKQLAGQR